MGEGAQAIIFVDGSLIYSVEKKRQTRTDVPSCTFTMSGTGLIPEHTIGQQANNIIIIMPNMGTGDLYTGILSTHQCNADIVQVWTERDIAANGREFDAGW